MNNQTTCHTAYTPVPPAGVALGIFLAVATFVGSLPQMRLLVKQRSSQGLSVLTLALVMTYGTLNVYATLTTKWPTLLSCARGVGCLIQLLDVLQQVVSALSVGLILLLIVAFPPNNRPRARLLAASVVAALLALGIATCAISGRAPCSALSLDFATVLTTSAGCICVVAFAPQLAQTWRTRGRGSLSYLYYTIQVVGCSLVVSEQIFALGDSWRVWLPTSIALVMQGLILAIGLSFRCRQPAPAPAGGMAAALLEE